MIIRNIRDLDGVARPAKALAEDGEFGFEAANAGPVQNASRRIGALHVWWYGDSPPIESRNALPGIAYREKPEGKEGPDSLG